MDSPVTIKGDHYGDRPFEYQGWIVEETDGLLAIDERYQADPDNPEEHPADWAITHLPSTFRVFCYPHMEAHTRERAIELEQRFYREAVARGWDLRSTDGTVITAAYTAMSEEARAGFWKAVAGDTGASGG